jgi:predicted metalloprotease with PDZ domain
LALARFEPSTRMTAAAPRTKRPSPSAGPQFRIAVKGLQSHLFAIGLTINRPARRQRVSLPVWIPGSYLVREFAQHLQHMHATQGGKPVPLLQVNKNTWQFDADPDKPLRLSYEVYAFDASVRTAFLDTTRGFFNATSLCVRVLGQDDAPHVIDILDEQLPPNWQLATSLTPKKVNARGFGRYTAANYDELADSPAEMGTFWSGQFVARGVPHRFIVGGAGEWFDGDRLLADTQRICETQIDFWHGTQGKAPFKHYLFMLHASGDGYGGLEHRHSTALICQRTDLPAKRAPGDKPPALTALDGYTTLLGLISHEYFHTWNVKRMRPAEFRRYDYDSENHTELLWFFEGFTSYYDDLILRRCGLINDTTYLHLVTKTVNQVEQTPGQRVQTVAQASFDAWLKYYRIQENSPNATVSYYTKGALVAMCLDLTLREEGDGTLDDLMRELWARSEGGPIRQTDIAQALRRVGKRAFAQELHQWVHGTDSLPLLPLLEKAGVAVQQEKSPLPQQLGLRVSEGSSIQLKNVLRGGAAEAAGMAAGDEWLAVEFQAPKRGEPAEAWRVGKLEEVNLLRGQRTQLTAIVARDKKLLRCPLIWPAPAQAVKLSVGNAVQLGRWLAP